MERPMIVAALLFSVAIFVARGSERAQQSQSGTKQNTKSEALRTLREADRLWSQSAPDVDKFMSFLSDDMVWFFCTDEDNERRLTNKNDIRAFVQKVFVRPGYTLTWTPDRLEVSDAGDMGYAFGSYTHSFRDPSGKLSEYTAYYAAVWRRQSGGDWKVVLEADY